MKVFLDGNLKLNRYYAQTLCMVFFPGAKFSEKELLPDEPYLSLTMNREGETYTCRAVLCDGKKAVEAEKKLVNKGDFSDERAGKVVSGQAVFDAGVALTGVTPPWGILTGVRPSKVPMESILSGNTPLKTRKLLHTDYFLNPQKAALVTSIASTELKLTKKLEPNLCSVYISIPFCPSRCAYCSFVSYTSAKLLSLIDDYITVLCRDIDNVFTVIKNRGLKVATVYIGGGTPTILNPTQLETLLRCIGKNTDVSKLLEFTLEGGRPDTIDAEKLAVAKSYGVNRVSVNPQTLSDIVLQSIGRKHTAREFYKAYDIARKSGIGEINVDLIAGLPNDNFTRFSRTVDKVTGLKPENITVHTFCVKKSADILKEKTDVYSITGGDVGKCVDYSQLKMSNSGYKPYYMYRQKNTVGNYENVGYSTDSHEGMYNIFMMEELHSIFAAGAGAVTKLVDHKLPTEGKSRIQRIFSPKYPYEYLKRATDADFDERRAALEREIDEFNAAAEAENKES